MDPNKFTQKTQEALQQAQNLAVERGHQAMDVEHLALALVTQPDGLVPRLLDKLQRPADIVAGELRRELNRRPSVSGGSASQGNINVTQAFQQLLVAAEKQANALKDEYLSVEHVMLALLEASPGSSAAARIFKDLGITIDNFRGALTDVRGHQRVQSNNPEATYESLQKYGRDLVEFARTGKMDPVIGRDEEVRPRRPHPQPQD